METILITGGTGYIGSHAAVCFLEAGYQIVLLDNLSNSHAAVLQRIATLTGQSPPFYRGNIADAPLLDEIFNHHKITGIAHFAGLKAVAESVQQPLRYYQNNVAGSATLCAAMQKHGCKKLIFSSSATVYGAPGAVAYTEDMPLAPVNPYGRTKRMVEDILRDLCAADSDWRVALLRYFNPVGAHPSGLIGEAPQAVPNNLMPYIAAVAVGTLPVLHIFGNDYPTADGTGVRDYIHVQDLVAGHLAAYAALDKHPGCTAYNLGTGKGASVLEVVAAFVKAAHREIPYQFQPRRPGDLAEYYAAVDFTREKLGWQAQFDLQKMVEDHWNWQKNNPKGYL
ncbi:MAG: UDP-glucose 4-epimerase GalE [Cellvibrionales bacterium]|nr:UDP-glucose 4-epimerase GalE [Cellvibrionales bacterium]